MTRVLRLVVVILSLSKYLTFIVLAAVGAFSATVCAETETIDLKALAKKARPAVMLLVVSDASGKEIATGTGFLVSSDGKLITNHHVIEGAASAVAKVENGGLFPVEGVLADDPENDLVLLKVKGKDLPFLPLGNSDKIEVGTRIAVIGSPLGLEGTLSEGIVSAVRELYGQDRWLQITAAISAGSSGSPVLDAAGEVVGVAALLLRGGQSLNFAIPADAVKKLVAVTGSNTKRQGLSNLARYKGVDVFSDPDFQAGRNAALAGDYAEALKRMKLVVARYPQDARPCVILGITYYKLKFYEDAISMLKHAAEVAPDDATPWIAVGVMYNEQHNYDEAVGACRQAVKVAPDNALAWCNLGRAYNGKYSLADAGIAFQQAIALNPEADDPWLELAAVLMNLRYTSRELLSSTAVLAERTLQNHPEHHWAWSTISMAFDKLDRNPDLVSYCQRAIKARPDNYEAWRTLAIANMRERKYDEAVIACRNAIHLKSDGWNLLGLIFENQGKLDDAIQAYIEGIQRKPDDLDAWYRLGGVYKRQRKFDKAITAYEQAAKLSRNDTPYLYEIGVIYAESGQRGKALEIINRLKKSGDVLAPDLVKELATKVQSESEEDR